MQKLTVIASLVVGALLATSCSDTDARVTATGPTALVQSGGFESPFFSVAQSPIFAQPIRNAFCPTLPPFTAVLRLSIRAGSFRLFIRDISLRFVDTSGIRMPQVTLPAPVLTTQFGSALVEARQTRLFPLSLGLGCGFGTQGTMTAVVTMRNESGQMSSGQVSAFVR
jgi:hypothetical protein